MKIHGVLLFRYFCSILFFMLSFVLETLGQESCDLDGEGFPTAPPAPGSFSLNTPPANKRFSNSVELTWTVSSSADSYRVSYRVDGTTTFTVGPTVGDGTSTSIAETVTVTGLSPNTVYDFFVSAGNTCQYCAPNCTTESSSRQTAIVHNILTAPAAPTTPTSLAIHQNKFVADWNSSTGAAEYRLDVSENNSFSTFLSGFNNRDVNAVTELEIPSLTPGNTYYYRVRAVNSNGSVSANSIEKKVVLLPPTPTLLAADNLFQNSFRARWNSVTADEGTITYQLVVDNNSDMSSPLATLDVGSVLTKTVTTTEIPSLTPGSTYYYRVKASNNGNFTNAVYQTTSISFLLLPAAPTLQAASEIFPNSFKANWSASTTSSGTLAYQLIIDDNSDLSSPLLTSNVGGVLTKQITTTEIPSLTAGTLYYYRVKATNDGSFTNSALQATSISALTLPATPTLLQPTNVGEKTFQANWNAVPSAGSISYKLEIDINNDFADLVYNADVGNVTQKIITTSEIPAIAGGAQYFYRVRASNNGNFTNAGVQTTPVSVLTLPHAPIVTGAVTQTSLSLSWDDVTGASEFWLQISTNEDFTNLLPGYENLAVDATEITIGDLHPGETYFARLRAANDTGLSDFSDVLELTLIPSVPDTPEVTLISTSGFQLEWADVLGASGYHLDLSLEQDFESLLPGYNDREVLGTSISVTSLAPGTTYYFRLRARNNSGVSASIDSFIATLADAPVMTASATQTSITLGWDVVSGATGYRLDISLEEGFVSFLPGYENLSVTGSSITIGTLSPATKFYCRLRTVNTSGSSANSNIEEVTTIPGTPTGIITELISESGFKISWDALTGAANYRLDISLDDDFESLLVSYSNLSVSSATINVTGLEAGVVYHFRVRSENQSGVSPSAASSVITLCAAPELTSTVGQTEMTLTWNTVVGASSYRLDVSEHSNFSAYLAGFEDRAVTGTSMELTGLSTAKKYYSRVRAVNASGTSHNSDVIEAITIPDTPSQPVADLISISGFQMNWPAIENATRYRIDVSADEDFNSILENYSNLLVTETSINVTGLDAGTVYYFRVRSGNDSGVSPSMGNWVITLPVAPVLTATATQTTITLNWSAIVGAASYRLDVSLEEDFATFIPGYENRIVTSNSITLTELLTATKYYCQIRAMNSSGSSENSGAKDITTIPDTPMELTTEAILESAFTITWTAVPGAGNYRVDVSTDDGFIEKLPAYSGLEVAENLVNVTGLAAGTVYHVRVRSENESGTSPYITSSVFTLSNPPVIISTATQSSISLEWNVVIGASSYRLDVGLDEDFDEKLPTFDNVAIEDHQCTIPNLESGVVYYIRIRSVNNSGSSEYSVAHQRRTIPRTPLQPNVSSITESGFAITWDAVNGSTNFRLDVSTDANFSSIVPTYSNLLVSGTSLVVNSLKPGTEYYSRLRAENESGASPSSVLRSTTTLPVAPINLAAQNVTANTFIASWSNVDGADFFELEVSRNSSFTDMVEDYNPRVVTGALEEGVAGLNASTVYYWQVRAVNESGRSVNSLFKIVPTLATDGTNNFDVKIDEVVYNSEYTNQSDQISVEGTAYFYPLAITISHKRITDADFELTEFTVDSPIHAVLESWTIEDSWLDEIGMQFYISMEDAIGQRTQSEQHYVLRKVNSWSIPITQHGTTAKDYQMISTPFQLDNNIEDMFEPILGAYDPFNWRFVRYQSNKNVDYTEGLSKTKMDRGKAFWVLSTRPLELSFNQGRVVQNSVDEPFVLHLTEGWNQIGNPYPFDLSWSDVLEFNGNPIEVGILKTFDGAIEGFKEDDVLKKFGGGFVRADKTMDLNIPVTSRSATGGRKSKDTEFSTSIDGDSWLIPITLTQDRAINKLVSIGMNPQASDAKDQYDELTLPRFIRYLEFNSRHAHHTIRKLSRDVVKTAEEHTWSFQLEYNEDGPIKLQWPKSELFNQNSMLVLHDLQRNILVNMKQDSVYQPSQESSQFKIYYNRNITDLEAGYSLGIAYPNPARDFVTIPYAFSNEINDLYEVTLTVVDAMGHEVYRNSANSERHVGIQSIKWDGRSNAGIRVPSGLYFIRLKAISSTDTGITHYNKVIIE